MLEELLTLGNIINAIVIIGSFLISIYKFFTAMEKNSSERYEKLNAKIDTMQESLKESKIDILRLNIMNDQLPDEERLKDGEEYIRLGGNGAVKKFVEHLAEEQAEELLHNNDDKK